MRSRTAFASSDHHHADVSGNALEREAGAASATRCRCFGMGRRASAEVEETMEQSTLPSHLFALVVSLGLLCGLSARILFVALRALIARGIDLCRGF